jgi:hypothetical protein
LSARVAAFGCFLYEAEGIGLVVAGFGAKGFGQVDN